MNGALMTNPNLVADWDGPVCWNDFEDYADDYDQAASDIADQLVGPWRDDWKFVVQCCVEEAPVVGSYADNIIEWIDDIEENNLSSGEGLLQINVTEAQKEELNTLITDWVSRLGITMNRWATGEPEMDITALVKQRWLDEPQLTNEGGGE